MKNETKVFFQIIGLLFLLFFLFAFAIWMLNTYSAVNYCLYYEREGYVTSLYWDSIFLMCDVALEYNDGNVVYVNAGSLGDTFVIENYGEKK
ncbi:hypothetical protein LCGC14_0462040 [marine sediment metagenome]|uniref:Uncharacterized protein n=1 Tax=marine sediment metagenome TaxID=412755 RepID=A0A0F9SEQ8_9ZZZZ